MSKATNRAPVKPDYYTNCEEINKSLDELKTAFGASYEKLVVSDIVDEQEHQYVELIQKGGGVWGIALVGYTYILEEVGIRFLNLAGTSAGAINTALLAVIGDDDVTGTHHKSGKKSQRILEYLSDLEMFSFVDGHPFARRVIKNVIKNADFVSTSKKVAFGMLGWLALLLVLDIIFVALSDEHHWADVAGSVTFVLSGLTVLAVLMVIFYLNHVFKRLKGSGYGVNPGNVFYQWILDRMEENNVKTITDLNNKLAIPIPGLAIRKGANRTYEATLEKLHGNVSIITSELVSQNKVEFPKMWKLFKTDIDDLHPARFVRASMSIPVFFESHMIVDIKSKSPLVASAWDYYFGTSPDKIPSEARFVDGGMLSNFPVNIFYNPSVIEPRLPSFGIDMVDQPEKELREPTPQIFSWDLKYYLGRMFNTMQNHYDKDFRQKNKVFSKGIGIINLHGHNWLNFFVENEEKRKMFIKGAQAATAFLKGFNWADYKDERIAMYYKTHPKNVQDTVQDTKQ